jgi:hypothetical protein
MKRSVIMLAMTCVVALAQDQTAPLTPQPDPWRLQAWKNALRVSPKTRIMLLAPPTNACAVPLLAAPVDPRIGAKMPVLKPPAKSAIEMPIAEGLPPCPR